jgi:hypothetical protein
MLCEKYEIGSDDDLRHYPIIWLERPEETKKYFSQDSWFLAQKFKENEAEMPINLPGYSLPMNVFIAKLELIQCKRNYVQYEALAAVATKNTNV